MTLHWIAEPVALYGVIAVASAAALHLFFTVKIELRRDAVRRETEAAELKQSLEGVAARLATLESDAEFEARSRAAVPSPMPRAVNVQKRSEALRMCRRGAAPQMIMARLGLSRAETALLMKVERALADQPASAGSSQERSSSFEYPLEA